MREVNTLAVGGDVDSIIVTLSVPLTSAQPPHAPERPPSAAPSIHLHFSPRRPPCAPAAAVPPPRAPERPPRAASSIHLHFSRRCPPCAPAAAAPPPRAPERPLCVA